MKLVLARKAVQYIFFEMLPSFVLGVLVFVFIILMFQALRYTEFVLIHGVGIMAVAKILGFIVISVLPALLPMSLLFAVLMTYGRLSSDSEIIALKASGLSMYSITTPAVLFSLFVTLLSAQTSFHVAPWGNRQFELLITKLGQSKAGVTIREGAFSEGFFDMVVYAHEVDSKNGTLKKVFIYDEKPGEVPLTIIAKTGQLIQDSDKLNSSNSALMRLFDGDIHRKGENHTKIKFNTFDLKLFDPIVEEQRAKSTPSLTIEEISEKLKNPANNEEKATLSTEFHKRWAISVVCLIFGLLGVGLGVTTDRRNQKSSGLIICLLVVISYWILYVSIEGAARSGQIPAAIGLWIPNLIFLVFAFWRLKKNWD